YLALFSLLFVGFGIFLYQVLANALVHDLDEALLSQASTTAGLFQEEYHELSGDRVRAAAEAVSAVRGHNSTIAIFEGPSLLAAGRPLAPGELQAAAGLAASSIPGQALALPVAHKGTPGPGARAA